MNYTNIYAPNKANQNLDDLFHVEQKTIKPTFVDRFNRPITPPDWAEPTLFAPTETRAETPLPKEADEFAQYSGFNAPSPLTLLNKPSTLMPAHVVKLWQAEPKIFFRDAMDVTLDLWQEEATDMYMRHARLALLASKGPGKEQPVSTRMYTPKGEVRFGDLKVGDEVFGENGAPTKVKGVYPQGVKDVYKVTFDDGSSTECGLEHLWKVHGFINKRKKEWGVVTLKHLIDRGISVMQGKQKHYHIQLPLQGAVQFPERNLPLDPFLVGAWLGNGSKDNAIITSIDPHIAEELERRGYEIRIHTPPDRCPNIRIYGIQDKLKEIGILDKYSYEKSIPEIYKTASIQQRKDLLAGLMDTDGTIGKRDGGCMEYDTSSPQLAEDVQWLVRSLGGKSSISTKRAFLNGVEHRLCYRVRVTLEFCPFLLERKAMYWHAPTQKRYLVRTMKNIELVRQEDSMCIEVEDPNHCYLTNDFIVTHNTSLLALMCWHFFLCYYRPKIACMSISEAHLKSNLWAELLMWRSKSRLLQASANDGLTRISLKGHEGYSFIDARSYPKSADDSTMAASLAGLHSDNVAFFIDEGGSIPDAIYNTADAALSGGDTRNTRARLVTTGNPEKPSGTIYRAYKESLRPIELRDPEMPDWAVYRVTGDPLDPKRAPRVSITWAQSQIKLYGRDNPWVKVNVLCEYPDVASDRLLTEAEVDAAMDRTIDEREVLRAQIRLGVDVARGGIDDSAIARRRGQKVYDFQMEPSSLTGPELAGKIQYIAQQKKVERTFIDNTGGYGGSVIDNLNLTTKHMFVTPVVYNASAQDKTRYANRRAEMYVRMRDWIKAGGCLPRDYKLKEELLAPEIWFVGNKFQLEDKAQIKVKLGRSPDRADALAQTFCDVEEESQHADMHSDPYGWTRPKTGHISDPDSQSESVSDSPYYYDRHHS